MNNLSREFIPVANPNIDKYIALEYLNPTDAAYDLGQQVDLLRKRRRKLDFQQFGDFWHKNVTGKTSPVKSAITDKIPFPVSDLITPLGIYGTELMVGMTVGLPALLYSLGQKEEAKGAFVDQLKGIGMGLGGGAIIFGAFIPEHMRTPIQEKMDLPETNFGEDEALDDLDFLVTKLNERSDSDSLPFDQLGPELYLAVSSFCEKYDGYTYRSPKKIKNGLFSKLSLRKSGNIAYFNPLLNEIVLNTDRVPRVVAHEIAHSKGFPQEAQAEIIGVISQIESKNSYVQYLGYKQWLSNLLSAINPLDEEGEPVPLTQVLRESGLNDKVIADLRGEDEYLAHETSQKVGMAWLIEKGSNRIKKYFA